MEFFRIGRLKADLAQRSLAALDTAKYLAAQGALLSIAFIPIPADTPADWPFLAYPVFAVVGRGFTRELAWLEDSQVAASIDVGVLALIAFVYWRMGIHLADVHRMTVLRGPGNTPPDLPNSL